MGFISIWTFTVIREITGTVVGKIELFFLLSFDGFLNVLQLRIGFYSLIITFTFWESTIAVGKYKTKTPEDIFYVFMNFRLVLGFSCAAAKFYLLGFWISRHFHMH